MYTGSQAVYSDVEQLTETRIQLRLSRDVISEGLKPVLDLSVARAIIGLKASPIKSLLINFVLSLVLAHSSTSLIMSDCVSSFPTKKEVLGWAVELQIQCTAGAGKQLPAYSSALYSHLPASSSLLCIQGLEAARPVISGCSLMEYLTCLINTAWPLCRSLLGVFFWHL